VHAARLLHRVKDVSQLSGLDQVPIEGCCGLADRIMLPAPTAYGDEKGIPNGPICADGCGKLEAIHLRHPYVGENGGRLVFSGGNERFAPITYADYFVPEGLKQFGQGVPAVGIVIRDQDEDGRSIVHGIAR
jgi:hypothetical protein